MGHKQGFRIGEIARILFYDVSSGYHELQVGVCDPPPSHALLRVPADEVPVILHGLAEGCDVELRHESS